MFQMIVNMHRHYDLYLTSYNPQKTRLMILNAEDDDAIRLAIYYPKPQRLDIYRFGKISLTFHVPLKFGGDIPKIVHSPYFEKVWHPGDQLFQIQAVHLKIPGSSFVPGHS